MLRQYSFETYDFHFKLLRGLIIYIYIKFKGPYFIRTNVIHEEYNDDVAKRHMPDLFTIISTSPINNY